MNFVYKLHFALAMDGMNGIWILGICALVWTLDCFVAFYLTLPQRRRSRARHPALWPEEEGCRSWWQRWKPAWKIRWRTGGYKLNFDLHRAGGLWLWAALLVFAWSSVYMNLPETVYTWAMRAALEFKAPWTELSVRAEPLQNPGLDWRQAQAAGERLMEQQAMLHGFAIEHPVALRLDRERGVYVYQVRSSRDIQAKGGLTQVFFDADSGELRLLLLPTGQYAGNTVTTWLFALHKAAVFGLPYRIFVCLLGLAIVMLSVTGVVIWLRKRRARRRRRTVAVSEPTGIA
ncbi:PepSY-associated TM helix domain-containing protein [Methylocaldum sp.]|uniref:PepSY-associated TM helix domain-containing protein n=1 Tax=Methylocaldum sp. TaxID=1969727 RepID=UPI0032207693